MLRETARQVRRLVVQSVYRAKAGHLGGPLSAADVLTVLYFKILRVDPSRPDWPDRDRFILSKGHSAIALYATLALRGFFPVEELDTFDEIDSRLQGHPDMTRTPGLDMSTGSLGQGLSPGVGMALGARLLGKDFHTWVMLGDGEIQEGQIWEAAFVAERYRLDNLTAILDYNGLQQY
ncbi:MAG TPA: transketolase, partial [Chloroflexota bacterium]|nr:transketolase [Chloroflexota bacterium]